jgi:hypothetical protein
MAAILIAKLIQEDVELWILIEVAILHETFLLPEVRLGGGTAALCTNYFRREG